MSGRARRVSVAAVMAAVPVLALAGTAVADGIHGSSEETSYWAFTLTTPDVHDTTTITLRDDSRPQAFLWGGGLAAAGGALLVLGVRGLRRTTPTV